MDVKEKVFESVAECLEKSVSDLTLDTDMDDVEEWDSMRNVMILSRLEEEFDIMIPEDDIFDLVAEARPWSVIEPIIGPATEARTAITIITTIISIRVKPDFLLFI